MEAAILKFFESIRCLPLTVFFGVFSLIGESLVLAGIVILIYWLADGNAGEQIVVTALTSIPVNVALKYAVRRPRPYAKGVVERLDVHNFLLSTRDLGDFVSFPSGHTQTAATLFTAVSCRVKKWWVWLLSAVTILLVMCSRLYFGVHYPPDVLAGLAFGAVIAVIWQLIYRYAPKARYFILCALALIALIPLFFVDYHFVDYHDYEQAAGLIAGGACFLPLCSLLPKRTSSFPKRLLRIPAGLLAAGAMFALTLLFPHTAGWTLLKWFLFTGAATLGAQAIFYGLKI